MGVSSLLVLAVCTALLLAAYWLYGGFLSRRLFGLLADRRTPAVQREDGVDFVPTRKLVLFGHHFASIAGLGPIVGPAAAVMWGWAPALAWVLLGGIFIGAVHDLGTMALSLRHQGRSVGDVCRDLMGVRAQVLFLAICFFAVALAMGVFVLTVAKLFVVVNPKSVIPVVSLVGIAVLVGLATYRWKVSLTVATLVGLLVMFGAIGLGIEYPVKSYQWFLSADQRADIASAMTPVGATTAAPLADDELGPTVAAFFDARAKAVAPTDPAAADRAASLAAAVTAATASAMRLWIWILLGYAFLASVLPVWLLLQPRDYLNSYQLYLGIALIVVLLAVGHPPIQAPAVAPGPADAPPMIPFLFILVACGAVSGFHSLVSSGTTARQLRAETDARAVGYGGMIVESLLAVLVVLVCTSGGPRVAALWQAGGLYTGSYEGILAKGLGVFASGVGAMSASLHTSFPPVVETIILVVVVGFAITTLDTGTRLLRFNVEELSRVTRWRPIEWIGSNRFIASLLAAAGVGYFALFTIDGKPAGSTLWSLFGATNQLLAGLGLLAVSVYLFLSRRPVWWTLIPMGVMLALTLWGMTWQMRDFWTAYEAARDAGKSVAAPLSLVAVGAVVMAIALWLFVEGVLVFARKRRPAAEAEPPAEAADAAD